MRALTLVPLLLVVACSDNGGGAAAEPATAPAETVMQAGQWETTTEVTKLTSLDDGAPAVDTPVGSKASFTSCIAEDEREQPAPALFAGSEGECAYKDFYMARGRMNASLACTPPGLDGEVLRSLTGTNDGDSFEGNLSSSTQLSGDGDVRIDAKISGRRIGDCPAEAG